MEHRLYFISLKSVIARGSAEQKNNVFPSGENVGNVSQLSFEKITGEVIISWFSES